MPLARINWIVIDLMRRAEGQSVVGAARKHHISRSAPGWLHTRQHVNLVVCTRAGAVNSEELLTVQSRRVNPATGQHATHVHWRHLVKRWCLVPDLRVA